MRIQEDVVAADYDDMYQLPDHWVLHDREADIPFAKLHEYYVNRVIDIIAQSGARTILEAGCGDGWNVGQMVKRGFDPVGVDWSRNAINFAQTIVPQARFHCGDVRDAAFRDRFPDEFDAVAFIEVIEHIPPAECVDALRNIVAPLKSGGLLVITTPHVNYPNTSAHHYRHFTPELLQGIVEEAGGLEVVGVEGYGDVQKDREFYQKMRFFDNRYYKIKPLVNRLSATVHYDGPSSFERCHGIIMTARKV